MGSAGGKEGHFSVYVTECIVVESKIPHLKCFLFVPEGLKVLQSTLIHSAHAARHIDTIAVENVCFKPRDMPLSTKVYASPPAGDLAG